MLASSEEVLQESNDDEIIADEVVTPNLTNKLQVTATRDIKFQKKSLPCCAENV